MKNYLQQVKILHHEENPFAAPFEGSITVETKTIPTYKLHCFVFEKGTNEKARQKGDVIIKLKLLTTTSKKSNDHKKKILSQKIKGLTNKYVFNGKLIDVVGTEGVLDCNFKVFFELSNSPDYTKGDFITVEGRLDAHIIKLFDKENEKE